MFSPSTYLQRRSELIQQIDSGLVLLLGHEEAPRNASANCYPFRQDSTFLYYVGLKEPNLALLLDIDTGTVTLFGDDPDVEEVVWTGPLPTLKERAETSGIERTDSRRSLTHTVQTALQQGRFLHLLPTYRAETRKTLQVLCGDSPPPKPSSSLIRVVVNQRSLKTQEEIDQIESALTLSKQIHCEAMRLARPGIKEQEVVNKLESIAKLAGREPAFQTIFSVHGETLHNLTYNNVMQAGDWVVHDSGVESELGYASDISRTFPVSGSFTSQQKDLYIAIFQATEQAINAIAPGIPFRDIHRTAATTLLNGLKDLGLIRGNIEEAVEAGAHTLFFPCGVGHMLGLDVHDMEALGEDYVGYSDTIQRDPRFGFNRLRLARQLEPGFVVTIEPGIYFIPALIDQWYSENKLTDFINYNKIKDYRHAGGVRIEEDVLVTTKGNRILGPAIPKTISEIEQTCQ